MRRAGHIALLALSIVQVAGCDWIDPMRRQKKYLPYQANPFFEDGLAMRPLVEGTIAREHPIGAAVESTGLSNGMFAASIPLALTPALLAAGRTRFEITCAACHGILGDGQSVVAMKMSQRPPPSLITGSIAAYPPGRVYQVISAGFGLMGSYAAELSETERWAVVAYWQALRRSQDAPLDAAPPNVQQRLLSEKP